MSAMRSIDSPRTILMVQQLKKRGSLELGLSWSGRWRSKWARLGKMELLFRKSWLLYSCLGLAFSRGREAWDRSIEASMTVGYGRRPVRQPRRSSSGSLRWDAVRIQ